MARPSQIVHVLHGMLAGFVFYLSALASIFLYIQFILYEYFEETKVRDEMYRELKEWSSGFAVGFLVSLIIRYLFGFGV